MVTRGVSHHPLQPAALCCHVRWACTEGCTEQRPLSRAPARTQVRWAYTEKMGIELESWERPVLMVVPDQLSTRGASNTLRLACEDLEVPPPPTA